MNKIYNFFGFLTHLNEIRFSDHWIERTTSSGSIDDKKESRILPYDKNSTDSGYDIDGFISNDGSQISMMEFLKKTGLTKNDAHELITYSLKSITRSKTLADWASESGKEYSMLYLGRICFYLKSDEKYYPILKSGVSKKAKDKMIRNGREPLDFYTPGDAIYGYVREKDKGMTIKYYPGTPQGEKLSYHYFKSDSKLGDSDFLSNYILEFPYGKKFEILVDLTDKINIPPNGIVLNMSDIKSKIDQQTQGTKEIELGPKVESDSKQSHDFLSSEWKRLFISKGVIIALQKFGESTGKIYEIMDDPINIEDIKTAYESGNLRNTPVRVRATEKYRNPYGILSNLKSGILTINPGDSINVIRTLRAQRGGKAIDPETKYIFKFITSEPKIIGNGQVQIALDISQ